MDTANLVNGVHRIGELVRRQSPVILVGMGTVGLITTVTVAIKTTPKALTILEEKSREHFEEDATEELTKSENGYFEWLGHDPSKPLEVREYIHTLEPKEIALSLWRPYLPVALMGIASIACFIGAQRVTSVRNAALAGAYTLAEKTLTDYKDKVKNILGEESKEKVENAIAEEKVKVVPEEDNIIVTSDGKYLCCDSLSGRYFRSDKETIRERINDFNSEMISDFSMSLNDWYCILGLPGIKLGDGLGWSNEKQLKIIFRAMISGNGEPCIVLDYDSLPTLEY